MIVGLKLGLGSGRGSMDIIWGSVRNGLCVGMEMILDGKMRIVLLNRLFNDLRL